MVLLLIKLTFFPSKLNALQATGLQESGPKIAWPNYCFHNLTGLNELVPLDPDVLI